METMLGKKVKCTITGMTGLATAKIIFMNGCIQYQIQPKTIINGVPAEAKWYDVEQLVLVGARKKKPQTSSGGPPPKTTPKRCFGRI